MTRRAHGRGGRAAAEPAPSDAWLRDLAARGRDPEAWARLAEDELMLIAYQQCLFFGATRDGDVAEAIGTLYRTLLERVPEDERNELLDRVTEAVTGGATNVLALLPFLQHETSVTIISRAAQSFATLMPLTAGDEMTGPRTLASMLEHADSAAVQAGIVTGLLLLGDRRVFASLAGAWHRLEPEARVLVTRLESPFAYAGLVEWLVAWLEDAEPQSRERVGALLVRLAQEGRGRVLDVVRKFPENARDERPEIEVTGDWPVAEFAQGIESRLRSLAAREEEPRVLPAIMSAWGLGGIARRARRGVIHMSLADKLRVKPGKKLDLSEWKTDATPGVKDEREAAEATAKHVRHLEQCQYKLHAEGRRSLLIVLQGMDAAGKDGVVRHVMNGFDPLGCRVQAFKVPTEEERGHDFLWRIHRVAPAAGEVTIFNRSHYEDVLVVRVHDLVPKKVWTERYEQINAFEALLAAGGTTVLKFFLHIGRAEQKRRLLGRLEDPVKRWKFNAGDIDERAKWKDYRAAYEDALSRCSTDAAPWYVIPADHKWYRDHAISRILVETFEQLDPQIPAPPLDVKGLRARLGGEPRK